MGSDQPARLRARVFISCGQNKQSDETSIASGIAVRLQDLGFDPYIAVQEQSLRGLKENIFEQLSKSEYFVFVDFKREHIVESGASTLVASPQGRRSRSSQICRGSLFSHQELAIASYLDTPVLAFQESGVKNDDGILRFLQANAIPFTDRHLLPNVVADQVRRRGWNPEWRNELVLERDASQMSDAIVANLDPPKKGRFFHIIVQNRHQHKTATNCYAYLEKATNLNMGTGIPVKAVELKWAGYMLPNAHIPPGIARHFDAFWIHQDLPGQLQFNAFCDSTDYKPRIGGEGEYELSYVVISDNFPAVRRSFMLSLNESLDLTTLKNKRRD